jgi:hypothetical protein
LAILAGLASPQIFAARLLALPFMVGIGLVSYGWYLWHWPILSFIRIVQLDEVPLPYLLAVAGAAFLLACASYRYLEQPIRRWRIRGGLERPGRLVAGAVAACAATALLGGLGSAAGYVATNSYVASRYGIEGQGVLDNGCRLLTSSNLAPHCLQGRWHPAGRLARGRAVRRLCAALRSAGRSFDLDRAGRLQSILFAPTQRRRTGSTGAATSWPVRAPAGDADADRIRRDHVDLGKSGAADTERARRSHIAIRCAPTSF